MIRLGWIPPWVAIKSSICARYDCNELRHEEKNGTVRRWCRKHCKEYEREARAIPAGKKLLWTSSSRERAGVPGNPQKRR